MMHEPRKRASNGIVGSSASPSRYRANSNRQESGHLDLWTGHPRMRRAARSARSPAAEPALGRYELLPHRLREDLTRPVARRAARAFKV